MCLPYRTLTTTFRFNFIKKNQFDANNISKNNNMKHKHKI